MRKPIYVTFYALSILLMLTGCERCDKKKDIKIDKTWKPVADKDGNRYESTEIKFDTNGDGVIGENDYKQEILMENLRTDATKDGAPTTDPTTGKIITACYKDMSVNCDTLGALYSVEKILGQSIKDQINTTAAGGDADGDGLNDEAVKQALIAAGYDPTIYTIIPEYNPDLGITGALATQIPIGTSVGGNSSSYSTSSTLTYKVLHKGDTIYTPGTTEYTVLKEDDTIYTQGTNGKILVPDMSKINWNTLSSAAIKGPQGICPDGYHVPTDGEWKLLELALGMSFADCQREGMEVDRGAVKNLGPVLAANLKLKYAGYASENGTYAQLGEVDVFWTATAGIDENKRDYVWIRYIDTLQHKGIIRKKHYDKSAFGVRCFKN